MEGVYFALPGDAAWREALQTWLERARQTGRAGLAAALAAELQKMPKTTERGTTVLDRLRMKPR